ncbi:hypothetical protein [Halomonas cerina]|uniref:Tripartite-type tricarboxylate transporter receptor subunit TctC n=1 Tax=Halomonas cerina TaxID=447424 RepID=A0A839V9J9_9GAMM|nr:hypothetical protein [Halomonas cerina]MBB3190728.1 tripartite-type tricarboxylate transporter receptor subunit TctC [Halomonas cerina]
MWPSRAAARRWRRCSAITGDLSELRSQLESGKIRVLAALSEERMGGPYAEKREARGLFPMSRFGDDFDSYVKEQVAGFKTLAEEVGRK